MLEPVASAKLPFLDKVIRYPTRVFIDRTGEHYQNYKRNLQIFLEKMLAERPAVKKAA